MNSLAKLDSRPWYREPWPWLLMVGPVTVVIAGFITLFYAMSSYDGLVADDYYKRGLTVNKELTRFDRAVEWQVRAELTHDAAQQRIVAKVTSTQALPAVLNLRITHPTRAGDDRVVALTRGVDGVYTGQTVLPITARWNVRLESAEWLLAGDWPQPGAAPLALGLRP